MSHSIESKGLKLTNTQAIVDAVKQLPDFSLIKQTQLDEYTMFDGRVVRGIGLKHRNWSSVIVIAEDGTIVFDDYNGQWGNRRDLETFMQRYVKAGADQYYHEQYGVEPQVEEIDGEYVLTYDIPEQQIESFV